MNIAYTVTTRKPFDAAVRAVEDATAAKGFRVLHVHDVQATFAEKGVNRAPYKIVEICNVKYASRALALDPLIGLMMPCKINVFTEGGETQISLLLPSLLAEFYPDAHLGTLPTEVETLLKQVVDDCK